MDRVSNLPKHILHDILSRLPDKDAARTSILSKAWNQTWSTFPTLFFTEAKFGVWRQPLRRGNPQAMEEFTRKRNNFLNYVDNTLQRFHDQGLEVKRLKFLTALTSFDGKPLSFHIDHWMELACKSGLEVLDFHLCTPYKKHSLDECYCLPPSMFEAKSLVKLILSGAFRVDRVILNNPIKFSSLQYLLLNGIYLEVEQIVQNLISSCPLIEYIGLKHCLGLNSVSIHGLPKLKEVEVIEVQKIYINAPTLERFSYYPADFDSPCMINLVNCKHLRELQLEASRDTTINDQWLLELFNKFPFLEHLELLNCNVSERIKISSLQLKVLKFSFLLLCNLKEVQIDAPELYSYDYWGTGVTMPTMRFLNSSSKLEANVKFRNLDYPRRQRQRLDFQKLREFIQNFEPRNVLVSLDIDVGAIVELNPEEMKDISVPPPSIKYLHIRSLSETETFVLPLVNGLLWSCRPAIISLNLNALLSKAFVKHLCEKLMGGKENECFCSSSHISCWWHDLKDVKVRISAWKGENVVDCKTLLHALPILPKSVNITFGLE